MDEKNKQLPKFGTDKDEIEHLRKELSETVIARDQAMMERNQFLNELIETRNSKTYKLAHALMAIPRKLRGYKYKYGELPDYQTLYPYMVSIVIAVYNTAEFLTEMIESILGQKQDVLEGYLRKNPDAIFRNHVFENIYEIILVDDGSDDGSEHICDSYADKYPWVKVLHKENGGVSSARNAGIAIAQGKYITFPDSDDKLSENVLEECFRFFEAHENEVSMVTYPLEFFDAQRGSHWTTYRFEGGTRILNMMEEWDKPQYFTAASFFKTSFIKANHIRFDGNLINGEDIKFVHEVLYRDIPVIGLIDNCTYWYRRRSMGEQSAIQKSKFTSEYYLSYIKDLLGWMLEEARDTYGIIPKYVQYAVMGQLQWRLRTDGDGELAKSIIGMEGFFEYQKLIKELVRQIDMDVIMSQRQLFREHFFYLCNIKKKEELQKVYEDKNIRYYFGNTYCSEAASCYLKLEFMTIKDGFLHLEGASANLEPNCRNWIFTGKGKKLVEVYGRRNTDVKVLGETVLYVERFKVVIPLTDTDREEFYFGSTIDGTDVIKTRIVLGKFAPISIELSKSYYSEGDWTIRLEGNKLSIWNMDSAGEIPDFEQEFEEQILAGRHGKEADVANAVAIRRQALNRRSWKRSGKQIWLISDRYSVADDNGEALFRYLMERHEVHAEVYFVIAKDSEDFERLSAVGKVLVQDSKEHMIFHLIADCIISSQADEYIINPVWRKDFIRQIYKDLLCRKKYVFLQHGVIKDDLSSWLNRYNKNIDGFVCAASKEAQSLRDYDYYYDKQIWLTGLPRYDLLYHDEKKIILVMPTWRKWLMLDFNAVDSDKDAIGVKDSLKETDYYRFYNELLNDSVLLDACEEYGYTLCFMPHSNLRGCMEHFERDNRVLFWGFEKKYREAFAEANLLITDYSSTAMDFAYLKKPVIYAQFDKKRFFSGEHTYQKGYFDYEQDGFGEVVYDLKTLVKKTIEYMEDGCVLKDTYNGRIDGFFAYNDQNNCQRVAEKIVDLMRD